MTNTTGHKRTPAVILKPKPSTPNKVSSSGSMPIVDSNEKILIPMNSATKALVTKNPPSIINKVCALFLNIQMDLSYYLSKCKEGHGEDIN